MQADTAAPLYIPGMQSEESATLMGALGVRLRHALQTIDRAPLVCSACRKSGQLSGLLVLPPPPPLPFLWLLAS